MAVKRDRPELINRRLRSLTKDGGYSIYEPYDFQGTASLDGTDGAWFDSPVGSSYLRRDPSAGTAAWYLKTRDTGASADWVSLAAGGIGTYNVMDYGARGDGTTDDTAAVAAVGAAAAAGGTVVFPPGTYRLTSHVRYTSLSDVRFVGYGAVLNTNEIAGVSPKLAKIRFVTCDRVTFEGFEIVGDNGGVSGDDVTLLEFFDDCTNCDVHDNYLHGVSGTTKAHHGLAAYANNSRFHHNYIKNMTAFGVIIIRDPTLDGHVWIDHNIVEGANRSFEPAYYTSNVTLSHNVSINPTADHFVVWPIENDTETSTWGIENVEISHNVCYGGVNGVGLFLGYDKTSSAHHLRSVHILDNQFYGLTRVALKFAYYQIDEIKDIEFVGNYVESDIGDVAYPALVECYLPAINAELGLGAVTFDHLRIEGNTLKCSTPARQAINLGNASDSPLDNVDIINNTFDNLGTENTGIGALFYLTYCTNVRFAGNRLLNRQAAVFKDVRFGYATYVYMADNAGFTLRGTQTTSVTTFKLSNNQTLANISSGTATVANGSTSVTVVHGVGVAPTAQQICVVPTNSMGNATKFYVGSLVYVSTMWAPETAYNGETRVPRTYSGYYYTATGAGTSGTTEPTWPTTPSDTVVDGTVTWTCTALNSTFVITVDADPGAATATFGWRVEV